MKKLVRLWKRPCKNGRAFKYVLIWNDELGKERWQTLGHTDGRQAQKQRVRKERELRMGLSEPETMKLSQFQEDCFVKTGGQVREGTLDEYCTTMNQFIEIVGDVDYRSIRHEHGARFIQACLKCGNRAATANLISSSEKKTLRGLYLTVEQVHVAACVWITAQSLPCSARPAFYRQAADRISYYQHRNQQARRSYRKKNASPPVEIGYKNQSMELLCSA